MENELKPCPFCGNIPELEVWNDGEDMNYKVNCTHCFCQTYYEDSEEEAVQMWNRRDVGEWC